MNKIQKYLSSAKNSLIVHTLMWTIAFQLLFDLSGLYYSFRELLIEDQPIFDEAFLLIPLLIILFYFNGLFLVPRFLNRQAWLKYLVLVILFFIVLLGFGQGFFLMIKTLRFEFEIDHVDFFDMQLLLGLITLGISTSWAISKIALRNATLQKEAKEKQEEAELKYLKTQLNPHFLFNTLNSIYSLANEEEAPQTTAAILKLSQNMRYLLKESTQTKVSLMSEIQFLGDYIDLQRIRLGQDFVIHFEVIGELDHIEIAPLLFLSFVENAFKYGVSTKNPQPISIKLQVKDATLHFECENEIVNVANFNSHEVGLNNAKARLELLYPKHYQLNYGIHGNKYRVELDIALLDA